jgi:hypothetical protein
MIKNNRNNEQIYGRNDMIMLDQNNKIYGSLGLADKYVMRTEEGTRLVLNNPKQGRFGDVLTEFNMYGRSEQFSTTGAQLFNENIEIKNRGVTIKINGSTVTFKGTVSDESSSRVNFQKKIILKPGKYTASSSNKKIFADFSVKKANDETIYSSHIEIDGTEEEVRARVLFGERPSAKGDIINETTNIMVNEGDIALPYEPYTGGKPSPSPEYPQEIKSVVNPIVKVTNEDGTQFETVTLPYTLNAIPVESGGNVTIDGQQYIADRVVEKDGVFGIERNTAIDAPVLTKTLKETPDMKGRFVQNGAFKKTFTYSYAPLVNIGYGKTWGIAGSVIDRWLFGVNKTNLYISPPKDLNYTSEDILNALKDLDIKVYGALVVPFFEPFTGDIQAKLRALVTYYPVTIVENNYNTWMKATYKSMESV